VSQAGLAAVGKPAGVDGQLLRRPASVTPFMLVVVALAFATLPLDRAVVAAFAGSTLVVLSAIDIERGIIPNRIVLPAAAIVLVAQLALFPGQASEWALAAVLAALALMIPQLVGRSWMGMGDVKLALLLGATLGWGVLGAVLIAFLCTFPVAVLVLVRGGLAARKTTIPFGPFLALGALIVLFGPHLSDLAS
jgi:leader peptidase (prepilin peptidase)/N-methyltransferase